MRKVCYICYIPLIVVLYSCGGSDESAYEEEGVEVTDTTVITPLNKNPDSLLKANLTYYCPHKMHVNQSYDIGVMISSLQEVDDLKGLLAKEMEVNPITDSADIKGFEIEVTNEVKVDIAFDPMKFEKIASPEHLDKKLSNENTEWFWTLKPKEVGETTLRIKVYKYVNNRWEELGKPKRFDVQVNIDIIDYKAHFYKYIQDNPVWPITAIIFPIITFFVGRWEQRRKNGKQE